MLGWVHSLREYVRVCKGDQILHDADNCLGVVETRMELAHLRHIERLTHLLERERLEYDFGMIGDPFGGLFLEIKENGFFEVNG